jgi:hypothetical protein
LPKSDEGLSGEYGTNFIGCRVYGGVWEVFKEEATVKTVGALKKWHRDRHLAIRRCSQLKKQTQGNSGSRKKLSTTSKGMTHHARLAQHGMAWHKGHCHTEKKEEAD